VTLLTNPVTLWQSLSPADQQRLGALAIATELAIQAVVSDQPPRSYREQHAYEITGDQAGVEFTALVREKLPSAYICDAPMRPDLNALGIRQCTQCGCTEQRGCLLGCSWVAPQLCSACISPRPETSKAA
jgi:hypothetical protein